MPRGWRASSGVRCRFALVLTPRNLLVHGTPDTVGRRVRELKALFPTGLIISPSHEAILPDIAPENIRALWAAVREDAAR